MPRRSEDATGWIGYADFLTTITLVFFLVAMVYGSRIPPTASAYLLGSIADTTDGKPLDNCLAEFGAGRQTRSSRSGLFEFQFDSVRGQIDLGLRVNCMGYGEYSELVGVHAGDTTIVRIS